MPRSIVIVHGWSDDSKSFRRLAEQLEAWFGSAPTQIRLADWISLQDDVTYADLAAALDRAWTAQGLSRAPRTVDVVVHSTGALVLRDWLTRHFDPASAPVKRFLMLAPANFGSPLAHKGRSFIGRVLKGWNRFVGQTGTQVLKGLELGSPYSWPSWNWLPHNATGLFAPWNCFSRLVRVSPISPSTPPSLSLPFLVTSRSCFSFFSRSARCLSFSRVWMTWFSDCSNCASLTFSPPEELPANGFGSAAAPGGE